MILWQALVLFLAIVARDVPEGERDEQWIGFYLARGYQI
jgi:hypothetical protein